MKSTENFKSAIKAYLDKRAKEDQLFEVTYAKTNKTMDECITYILNSVQKSGCNGFTDDEVYAMAVHYYDEDHIEVGKPINCRVAVNHTVELTAEEREEARQQAIRRAQDEAYIKMTQRPQKSQTKQETVSNQLSLF
ncbi:MAG: PcfK-like family protein [Tannerella sp.]|jgi:hypothetical protein|nr:PcfK-like family protein [Tannerella sp.]